jgi:CarD family transcriptional regulator
MNMWANGCLDGPDHFSETGRGAFPLWVRRLRETATARANWPDFCLKTAKTGYNRRAARPRAYRIINRSVLSLGGHVTFDIGDKVIYPNHGLGVVQRIETRTIMGMTCGFYQLRMVSNDTTVLVPVENADNVGLRKAVGNAEIDRLFSLLSDGKIDTGQNWKGRFKDNSDRMRTGSLFDVVEVLKSLTYLARSKNLSFREKRMLDRAKFLVVSEVAEVTHEQLPSVESRVEQALERCFAMKNRTLARQAAAKAAKVSPTPIRRAARAS